MRSQSPRHPPPPCTLSEAIPIACLGLAVNVASAWLLSSGGDHHHGHSHEQSHGHRHEEHDGARQLFTMADQGAYLESTEEIPEPHAFTARLRVGQEDHTVVFDEHEHVHGAADRDNNRRAAIIHVMADAAASVLVIVDLLLARAFGWLWMAPLAGIIGACVFASWSYGLLRDTGAILLDMNPERRMAENLRQAIENDGDKLADLHLWRLGPGHLGAIVSVNTKAQPNGDYYRARLARFRSLSHLTIEVRRKRQHEWWLREIALG